ncbi:phosphoribosylformylglycinamidine synthase, purS protein [Propionimicrobium lymphophilum ACS-093-V-SCH5]|uniref:Phosphoribosylformylglycinamidine synthase subunit PurS n=1 Tax=Propionimicrobium lymphophilum ACS-093-V-SCH5 TaxID=883161 RepID=S2VXQ0_9ACTN|nr:phosphoribosylformylglycinamidine synthase, purS protein [Propionimicrobium lymphophilum ACS-093-V-SCH5]
MGFFSRSKSNKSADNNKSSQQEQVAPGQVSETDRAKRVVVNVMPKPEILDPQGKAVSASLRRLGYEGLSVRQGKRFEIEVEGEITDERLEQIRHAAETLLANTVIEKFDVTVEMA